MLTFGSDGAARRLIGRLCLVAPLVALLWVPLYAGEEPRFLGLPFFYWYLFAWVLLTPALLGIAYATSRAADGRAA
jgi:hypothetical protein